MAAALKTSKSGIVIVIKYMPRIVNTGACVSRKLREIHDETVLHTEEKPEQSS